MLVIAESPPICADKGGMNFPARGNLIGEVDETAASLRSLRSFPAKGSGDSAMTGEGCPWLRPVDG